MRDHERGVGGVRKSIHQSWLAKRLGLGLGLVCWGFKGVQEEIPWEEASTLQIGSVTFLPWQYTVYNSILVTDYLTRIASRQFVTLPIVQTLLPVTVGYSLSSEAVVVMRQLRRWKMNKKILQYFGNVMLYAAVPNVFFFISAGKVTNHTGLSDVEFVWYSPIATRRV